MNIHSITLDPNLGVGKRNFIQFCKRVESEVLKSEETERVEIIKNLRSQVILYDNSQLSIDDLKLLCVKNVILDFITLGWILSVERDHVKVTYPTLENNSLSEAKGHVRAGHLIERDFQLQQRSVAEFIHGMERRRLTSKGWHSIFSVMRDGTELADRLNEAVTISDEQNKIERLPEIIAPYLQFVEGEKTCSQTGLSLRDIWRYFRHTWVNSYKSLPGRSIQILIRDSGSPNHPVIGIAALGSSVVQQKVRDKWIGWHETAFVQQLAEQPTPKKAKWLLKALENLVSGIYIKDIVCDGLCDPLDIEHPSDIVIEKLKKESQRAIEQHRRFPHTANHKSQQKGSRDGNVDWERQALSQLYRSKRCGALATLFSIKKVFQECGFYSDTQEALGLALKSGKFRLAIGQLIRFMKAEHVGVKMMDIIVCGSIAPYNLLLGGKLVSMMMCSPEITQYYANRYGQQVSIIASSVKGSPVIREPKLVLLGTTSLYGVGSSQYNRIKIPTEAIGGSAGGKIEFLKLGFSEGFGSYHFSNETFSRMNALLARGNNGRRVNYIFGEGVNPRMRHIREALEVLRLPSDLILRHGNKRVVYGVPLARNFREILLGLDKKPLYLLPQSKPRHRTNSIANYWIKRWLAPRITKPGILEDMAEHKLCYPINHGARVPIGKNEDDDSFIPGLLD